MPQLQVVLANRGIRLIFVGQQGNILANWKDNETNKLYLIVLFEFL